MCQQHAWSISVLAMVGCDVTLVLGIYVLDSHVRSLRAFQNGVSPASCFQLDQSALVFLSSTGRWSRTLISAWCETSGKNGDNHFFTETKFCWVSLSKSSEHSSPYECLKCSVRIASCWLLFFRVKSKNVCFSLSLSLEPQQDLLQQYEVSWHCMVQVHNANLFHLAIA